MRPLMDLVKQPGDEDTLEARLLKLPAALKRNFKTGAGQFAPDLPRQKVLDAREALLRALESFSRDAGADFAAALRDEMQELCAAYSECKQQAGKLDFEDLLLLVRNLVRDDRSVRQYLQNRFSRIFVDEFQDTDPLQAEILILLSADDPAANRLAAGYARLPASFSWSATPNSRFTNSDAPMWRSTKAFARRWRRAAWRAFT